MRILHTADIHLDSPLTALRLRAGRRGDELADATRRAFKKLVDYTIEQKLDVLLISGDNWDGRLKDYNALLFFATQMKRLTDAGCRVVIIRGNHDADNTMTLRLTLPEGVRILSAERPETVRLDDLGLAIHGQSFPRRDVKVNLAANYPDPVSGMVNIGMLHTAVQDYAGAHTPYAPCTVTDLVSKGYDYWALGHVHKRTEISTSPWIVYPGNLQARHINESGSKGATLVTAGSRIESAVHVPLDVLRWERVEIDVSPFETVDDLFSSFETPLMEAAERAEGRSLAVRIALKGKTPLNRALKSDTLRIEAEAARAAEVAGDIWLDEVEIETSEPSSAADSQAQDDALAAVIAEAELLKDGTPSRGAIEEAILALPKKLTANLRKDSSLDAIDDAAINRIIEDAKDILLARLSA